MDLEELSSGVPPKLPKNSSKQRGAKVFQCTGYGDCNMTFSRSEHLSRHIRKHTGERPFKCECGRSFSRLDNQRQHIQTVHANDNQLYHAYRQYPGAPSPGPSVQTPHHTPTHSHSSTNSAHSPYYYVRNSPQSLPSVQDLSFAKHSDPVQLPPFAQVPQQMPQQQMPQQQMPQQHVPHHHHPQQPLFTPRSPVMSSASSIHSVESGLSINSVSSGTSVKSGKSQTSAWLNNVLNGPEDFRKDEGVLPSVQELMPDDSRNRKRHILSKPLPPLPPH